MLISQNEYKERLRKTKQRMEQQGIEVLLITNPANMNYLSGYDGWSFYVDQMLVVIIDEEQPLWIGRFQDANAAKVTTWLDDENIIPYGDQYIHSTERHPMEFVGDILIQFGQANRRIGLEMESYYFSALCYEKLRNRLPNTKFVDASLLVNWIRLIKSDTEIELIKKAAKIVEKGMTTATNAIQSGTRQCDAAAIIYHDLVSGTKEHGGDYPAIVPLLPTGEGTSTPHLTWTDKPFKHGELTIIEIAGCYNRYHSPLARTVSLGKPSDKINDISKVVVEGINAALDVVKPGIRVEEIEAAWKNVISKHGIEKESRLGYSIGLNYPPDWGEHTVSIREGDKTILQPNMAFHMIPGIWLDDIGVEISESFYVTENGCEVLANFPRELIVKEDQDVTQGIL